jgi:16S rRNA (cytosine967-C5)-methyltransferase
MTIQPDMLEALPGEGLAAREGALGLLAQVFGQKKMLDQALEREPSYAALSSRDRAFARMMAATVLRRRGQMDDLITRCLNKGEEPRPEILKWILYLGIAQILFMDVADHAAVDTSVTLAAQHSMEGKKGFVNAILRRIAGEEGRKWLAGQDVAALNIPPWLYKQWVADYGFLRAGEIGAASLTEAPLDITVKEAGHLSEWARRLDADILPGGALRREAGGNVTTLDGFADGAWWVQDASAAFAVRLMRDIADKKVLDLCAAPGGKTMQLAAAGAIVTALDRSAPRMSLLQQNLQRIDLSDKVKTIIEDGGHWQPRDKFQIVLLDAPCTATGTIRRHPDLLSLKNEKDQAGLESIQERLLQNAAGMLEKNGILFYCTCSLQKAEGERQVDKFLRRNREYRRLPFRLDDHPYLEGLINGEGDVRILPHYWRDRGGLDGFYIARLQKVV